jgi:hypothetical protein
LDTPQTLGHESKAQGTYIDPSQWIALRRVEASGYDDEVGSEFPDDGEEELLACEDIVIVSDGLAVLLVLIPRRFVIGKLNIVALAFALANHLQFALGAWEERPHVVAVDRDVQHRVVVVEDITRAIPNMHVPIENADLLLVEFLLGHPGSHRHIIEETEA